MKSMQHSTAKNEREGLMQELQFLGQMVSTENALFHQTIADKHGISVTDLKTISTLLQEGPKTAGQLADRLGLTTGAITSVIDRLESRKFAKRKADPSDRRKVIVEVNTKEMDSFGTDYESMGKTFQRVLSDLTTEQLRFLVAYYKITLELTKQEIQKVSAQNNRRKKSA